MVASHRPRKRRFESNDELIDYLSTLEIEAACLADTIGERRFEDGRPEADDVVERSIHSRVHGVVRGSRHIDRRVSLMESRLEAIAYERKMRLRTIENGLADLRLRIQLGVVFAAFVFLVTIVVAAGR